jgi:hypothetical protein
MRPAVIFVVLAALTGCMGRTPEQRIMEAQNACTGYGFKAGTDAYSNCLMNTDQSIQHQDAQRREAMADALDNVSANIARQNRSVTCNSSGAVYGNMGHSTTTCY